MASLSHHARSGSYHEKLATDFANLAKYGWYKSEFLKIVSLSFENKRKTEKKWNVLFF